MDENLNFELERHVALKMEPKMDMMFDSDDAVYKFYATYVKALGFGVTISNSKSKSGVKYWVRYSCHKAGLPKKVVDPSATQPTTKTGCEETIKISKQIDNKWKVNSVHLEHNHELDPDKSRYLRCYRKIPLRVQREIELNSEAGINMNQTINSLQRTTRGSQATTWLEKDARNLMDEIRRHDLKGGDAQAMMHYFQNMQADNKDFFYSIDLDDEKCLTRVFWADARSREAYKEFDDVVTFDTTYLVNKFNMSFAPFVGVHHHGQSILFGCGLVTKEDTSSFVWLFKAWLACMMYVPPHSIITDQDRAMQNAIKIVFPTTKHRWCLWHIMKKVPEKFKAYLKYEKIQSVINKMVYDSLSPHEFKENSANFTKDYNLDEDDWTSIMYDETFVNDTFWAEFTKQYENALRKRVESEEEEDAKSVNSQYRKASPYKFEQQFHDAYTLSKYKQFRKQIYEWHGCEIQVGPVVDDIEQFVVEHDFEVGTIEKTIFFNVQYNGKNGETNCICRMFESKGMVCAHMLRVWKWKKLCTVPTRYILNRWRKDIVRSHTKVRLSYTNWKRKAEWIRFDDIKGLFNKVADMVISSESKTNWFKGILEYAIESGKEKCLMNTESVTKLPMKSQPRDENIIRDPKQGTKKGALRKKRTRSEYEKASKKKVIAITKIRNPMSVKKKKHSKKDSEKSLNLDQNSI